MAVSKVPMKRSDRHTVYTGAGTYRNDIGSTATCSLDLRRFSAIYMTVFADSITGYNRRFIFVPIWYMNQNAAYYLYATPTGYGSIRLEVTNDTINLLSATESSLYVAAILALD